jgi:hypothetical protein
MKELARSYLTITKDLRVMNRYAPRYRAEWLAKISEAGVRRRAEHYYQQLDALRPLRNIRVLLL